MVRYRGDACVCHLPPVVTISQFGDIDMDGVYLTDRERASKGQAEELRLRAQKELVSVNL